ncbi:MAG: hypothetical protein LBC50_00190 [Candidatus Ancillula sp.]|nr:hypothetical protein [Candidatus Ancillula sp.]
MYKALFNVIPLPVWLKVILVLLILAGIVALCFQVIFPWLADILPYPIGNANFPDNP